VEAKKPSIAVKDDILPAYQIRRYGWSAKLPVSIITDFEEFAVYDCTKKPIPADKASVAAETLAITADRLKANGLVDRVVEEPLGGAQRDWDAMFQSMRRALTDTLGELRKQPLDALLDARYQRLRAYGSFKETPAK